MVRGRGEENGFSDKMLGKRVIRNFTDYRIRKGENEICFNDQGFLKRGDENVLSSTVSVCMG